MYQNSKTSSEQTKETAILRTIATVVSSLLFRYCLNCLKNSADHSQRRCLHRRLNCLKKTVITYVKY